MGGAIGATFTPWFATRQIPVDGSVHVPVERIRAIAGIASGEPTAYVDTDAARRALEADPWIARATVRRDLPSAIRIGVVERVPVAAIDDRSGRVIAADGTVLPGADGRGLPQVDVVTGTDLTAAGAVLGAIPTPWRSQVTRVTTDVDGTLVLELVGGGTIRYGYPEQVRAKGAVIGALLARGRQPGERVPTTIDVSAPSAPTTGPTIGS